MLSKNIKFPEFHKIVHFNFLLDELPELDPDPMVLSDPWSLLFLVFMGKFCLAFCIQGNIYKKQFAMWKKDGGTFNVNNDNMYLAPYGPIPL